MTKYQFQSQLTRHQSGMIESIYYDQLSGASPRPTGERGRVKSIVRPKAGEGKLITHVVFEQPGLLL